MTKYRVYSITLLERKTRITKGFVNCLNMHKFTGVIESNFYLWAFKSEYTEIQLT